MDLFLAACGMTGPLVLEVVRPDEGPPERLVLEQPFALVGRAEGADVQLQSPRVGRRHVLLHVLDGRLYCADLKSRDGIRRGGGIPGSGWLAPGESLEVGPYTLRLRGGVDSDESQAGEAFNPMASEGDEPPGLVKAHLAFPGRAVAAPPWPLNRVLTLVGRSSACRVRLGGPEVSQFHAALVRTPLGVWAVDLLGRGGISISGQTRRWGRMGDGDELAIAQHRVRVRYGDVEGSTQISPAMLPAPARVSSAVAVVGPPPGSLALPPAAGGPPGVPPEQAALAESLLGPLMDRFSHAQQQMLGQVQQQMFDQFQQVLMVVLQMFGRMHREQMDVVHRELAEIRAINGELEAARVAVRQLEASRPPVNGHPTLVDAPTLAPPGLAPTPTAPQTNGVAGRGDAAGSAPGPKPKPVATTAPAPAAGDEADLHAKMVERVMTLQREQQGRWQRLLGMMTGAADETP